MQRPYPIRTFADTWVGVDVFRLEGMRGLYRRIDRRQAQRVMRMGEGFQDHGSGPIAVEYDTQATPVQGKLRKQDLPQKRGRGKRRTA